MDIFEKIDMNYKLSGEVINVLIHYLMTMVASGGDQRMNRNFVEAIASNMLVKQVNTYEKAVRYIRDQSKVKGKGRLPPPQAQAPREPVSVLMRRAAGGPASRRFRLCLMTAAPEPYRKRNSRR